MQNILHRLAELSRIDWVLLPQLALASYALRIAVRMMSLPQLARLLVFASDLPAFSILPFPHRRCSAAQLITLADRVARAIHRRNRCLTRSLLICWLLKIRRESAQLLIGVSTHTAIFESHAWITHDGEVVLDTPNLLRRFTTLQNF
ncbi:MAG: lasso peptide biosynthesis B2 protein [Nitrospirota bacterium]